MFNAYFKTNLDGIWMNRFLFDSLHQHGFCSSYKEVQMFERSASVTQHNTAFASEGQFVQYVADNVDHNIRTLDGLGTFHGMGMIATLTPGKTISSMVPRRNVSRNEIIKAGRIKIHQYNYPKGQEKLCFRELAYLRSMNQVPVQKPQIDILWTLTPFLQWPRPGWSGFMQMVHKGTHPGKATVVFLPMIDLDPTDMTCIYSTMLFLAEQAQQNKVTPVITFDQPLWWKGQTIITNEPCDSSLKSVVLRIGGLHTEMSYLGCIGHFMENSGLSEALEVVYGSSAVTHMLSGKALARAHRGHFLVDAALNIVLLAEALKLPLPNLPSTGATNESFEIQDDDKGQIIEGLFHDQEADDSFDDTENNTSDNFDSDVGVADNLLVKVKEMFEKLLVDPDVAIDDETTTAILDVSAKLEQEKQRNEISHTSCLWLQYMKMIDILKRFLRAERTGNWNLHLATVQEMLPYFAAAGHNLYARTTSCTFSKWPHCQLTTQISTLRLWMVDMLFVVVTDYGQVFQRIL